MNEPTPTTVRIDGDLSIILSHQERRRLLIRVMCELIAYGEDDPQVDDEPSRPLDVASSRG